MEIGNPAEKNRPGNVIISGYINDRDTKEPVSGVTVFIQKLSIGTISNRYGYYTLTIPRGIHLLQFSFIGMREKNINLNLYGAGELNVEMNSVLIPLKETIVSANKSITLQRFEVGAEKINITSFKLLPTSMGESDIIKSVLLLPGVQSVGEGSTGFNVRGGSADQNLILLYGAPVYNSSHFFTSRFFSALSINNSSYNYNISSSNITDKAFVLSHNVNSSGLNADFNWFTGRNEINFGLNMTRYAIIPGSYLPYSDSSLVIPHIIPKENALEAALYIDDKLVLTNYLSVNFGLRMSSFYSFGPQSVMLYDNEYSKSNSTIIDTLNIKRGKTSSKYAGPEFRVSLNFRISDKNSLKLNYNRTRQYLHLLSNSASISPTDTWKLSDYYIKPQVGDQVALGFYQLLFGNGFETSAEVYFKTIKNMIDFKGGTNLIMIDNIEQEIVNVKGRAYGIELGLKKTEGKLRYTIAYTYSRTFVKSLSNFYEEIINDGNWFPANFDKPNDLIFTFNYLFSRRYSFSANYTYSTRRPITFPVATYPLYDNILVHYSDRNQYRIPDYSRLDLSFKFSGNLRSHKTARPNWTFSVYNMLGRENVYSIFFKREEDIYKGYKLSVFGRAIPSVTLSFEF